MISSRAVLPLLQQQQHVRGVILIFIWKTLLVQVVSETAAPSFSIHDFTTEDGDSFSPSYTSSSPSPSSSSIPSSSSALTWEGKVWFTLLVIGLACLDLAMILLWNAAIWRPRWEARFQQYIDEGSTVLGYCHKVRPIKKTVVCGFVWDYDQQHKPPPTTQAMTSITARQSSKLKIRTHRGDEEVDDPTNTGENGGSRPIATNRHTQVVEYQFTIRYKFLGHNVEKNMMLRARYHNSFLPRAGQKVQLLVLKGHPSSALFADHVYYELATGAKSPAAASSSSPSPPAATTASSSSLVPPPPFNPRPSPALPSQGGPIIPKDRPRPRPPTSWRLLGVFGGKPGYIWGIWFFCIGILLPLWPLKGFQMDDDDYDDDNDFEPNPMMMSNTTATDTDTTTAVANLWKRIGIVVVANLVIVIIIHVQDFANRQQGHPEQFQSYLGTVKKKTVQWRR